MALLESLNIPLGTKMPDFKLKDPFGKLYKSDDLYGDKIAHMLLLSGREL